MINFSELKVIFRCMLAWTISFIMMFGIFRWYPNLIIDVSAGVVLFCILVIVNNWVVNRLSKEV